MNRRWSGASPTSIYTDDKEIAITILVTAVWFKGRHLFSVRPISHFQKIMEIELREELPCETELGAIGSHVFAIVQKRGNITDLGL